MLEKALGMVQLSFTAGSCEEEAIAGEAVQSRNAG